MMQPHEKWQQTHCRTPTDEQTIVKKERKIDINILFSKIFEGVCMSLSRHIHLVWTSEKKKSEMNMYILTRN